MVRKGDRVKITFGTRRGQGAKVAAKGSRIGRWKLTCEDGRVVEYPEQKFVLAASRGGTKKKKIPKRKQCFVCKEAVYANEKIEACGHLYHCTCFKCFHCKKGLNLQTYKEHRGQPFCSTCFGRTDGAAQGFGPGRVGNYEWAYAQKGKKEKSVKSVRNAARRSFERRKKKPSFNTRSPRKKPPPARSPTRERLIQRSPPKVPAWKPKKKKSQVKRAPKPKKVSLFETQKPVGRPKLKKQVRRTDITMWECVYRHGVSYRKKFKDNSSKIKFPKGPMPGDVVKAYELHDGWIRVMEGSSQYWLPTRLDGVGTLFREKGGASSSGSSFFSWGRREESSNEEEESSDEEPPPPRVPVRRASPKKKKSRPPPRKKKSAASSSQSVGSMLGGLFRSLTGAPTDEEKGCGSEWQCVFEGGVGYRTRCGDLSSKVRAPRGPECDDVVRAEEYQDMWIRVKVNGRSYWLPTRISGIGVVLKLTKKAKSSAPKPPKRSYARPTYQDSDDDY